jgi:hypothetical protein
MRKRYSVSKVMNDTCRYSDRGELIGADMDLSHVSLGDHCIEYCTRSTSRASLRNLSVSGATVFVVSERGAVEEMREREQ